MSQEAVCLEQLLQLLWFSLNHCVCAAIIVTSFVVLVLAAVAAVCVVCRCNNCELCGMSVP